MFLAAPAAAPTFFPPWYFWLFVFATVVVVCCMIVFIVYLNVRAETERRIHEDEAVARLMETMIVQRKMSAQEIEQVIDSYRQLGGCWHYLQRWLRPRASSALPKIAFTGLESLGK
jgi:hypothetical protein